MTKIITNINSLVNINESVNNFYLLEQKTKFNKDIKLSEKEKEKNFKLSFLTFFPKIAKLVNTELLPKTKLKKNSNPFLKYIKGLDLYINTERNNYPNAWTYPAILHDRDNEFFHAIDKILPINYVYAFYGFRTLSLANIKVSKKDKYIIFKTPPDLYINLWQTSGLVNILNDKELFSVYLHEIGHWIKYKSTFLKILFTPSSIPSWLILSFINSLAIPILIFLFIISMFIGRFSEYQADSFVNQMGYGEAFKSSLYKLHGLDLKDSETVQKKLESFGFKFFKILETLNVFSHHPHFTRRVKRLNESNNIDLDLLYLLESSSKFEITGIKMSIITKLFSHFDDFASTILKQNKKLII